MYKWALRVFPVFFILAVQATAADDRWEKQFAVTGKPELRVETNDAHIRIATWDRREVETRVLTRNWAIGPNDVRITERQFGNQVDLDVRVPNVRWSWGTESRSVTIEVMLPAQADVMARTGDGHVTVSSISGRLEVNTGDGHISLNSIRGEMRLYTGDGRIEGDRLDGKLDAQTGDGSIRVHGRFDALDVRSGDGSIQVEVADGSNLSASWNLRTHDGSIRLRVPRGLKAELDARTGDGRINLELPVTVSGGLSRSSVRGTVNGGGPLLRLRSGDGSITLEAN